MVKHALVVASLFAALACGSTSTSPTAPAPLAATVTTIAVTTAVPTATGVQLKAVASFSDGSTRDVTSSATWTSSALTLATVSPTGLVSGVDGGDVVFQATYLGVSGSIQVPVVRARFTVSGFVAPVYPNRPSQLEGAMVTIASGPNAGMFVVTNASGEFTLTGLRAGVMDLRVTYGGYNAWVLSGIHLDSDQGIFPTLFPIAPLNANGERATAQCNDATWTWTQTEERVCFGHGGLAWGVCPGPLCEFLSSRIR